MSDSFLSFLPSLLKPGRKDNSTDEPVQCISDIDHYKFYQFALIPAVLLTILFACTKKRIRKLLSVLDGRPGLIYPMDTLTRSSRISYCSAYGATAFLVYVILLEKRFAIEYDGPMTLKSLIAILSMFVYGLVFFPVFASLAMATAFSYFLGSLYIWMFLVVDLYKLTECSIDAVTRAILFVRAIPSLLCLGYLSLSLPFRFCLACWNRRFFASPDVVIDPVETLDDIKNSYQGKHVRELLRKPEMKKLTIGVANKVKATLVDKVHDFFYHRQSGFRYPTRLVSVMFIAACVVYVVTLELLVTFIHFINLFEDYLETQLQALGIDDEDEDPDEPPTSIQIGLFVAKILYGSMIAAVVTACLTTFVNILHMFSSFRANLLALYRGDYSNIPSPSTKKATSLCLGSMKYAGFQVAYIVWAYIISSLIIFIVCIGLSVFIIIMLEGYTDWLVNYVLQIWPSVLVAFALLLIQMLLATFVFLQDRGQHLRLDNRKFFFIFTFFMFFYNIFLGVISCLMRIIKAMIVGTLLLARLDNSTLSRKFEFLDPGFSAYQGYIHMEVAHTHPVMLVFIRLLMTLSKSRKMNKQVKDCVKIDMSKIDGSMNGAENNQTMKTIEIESQRPENVAARFNWHVAYTLLQNPQVRLYRKGFFQAMKKARAEGLKIPISDKPITDFDLVKTQEERELERLEEIKKLKESQPKKNVFSNFSFGRNSSKNSNTSDNASLLDEKGKQKKKHFWFGSKKKSVDSEVVNSVSLEEQGSEMEVLNADDDDGECKETQETWAQDIMEDTVNEMNVQDNINDNESNAVKI